MCAFKKNPQNEKGRQLRARGHGAPICKVNQKNRVLGGESGAEGPAMNNPVQVTKVLNNPY